MLCILILLTVFIYMCSLNMYDKESYLADNEEKRYLELTGITVSPDQLRGPKTTYTKDGIIPDLCSMTDVAGEQNANAIGLFCPIGVYGVNAKTGKLKDKKDMAYPIGTLRYT